MAQQAEVGALRVSLAMNAGEFERGSRRAEKSMDSLSRKAKQLAATFSGALIGAQYVGTLKKSIQLWGIQEDAVRAVEATLRTTGGTVGRTSKQLQDMASKLQGKSIFGDEDILKKVTNNLLTFGNIVGPVFDRAQEQALNLSQVLGQDLQSSAIQLGKALNDPITGITALSRVGIAFTQQQKDQIKTLIESGQTMKAQGVILDEITKFYGEAAKAAANTSKGAMAQAANAVGDAFERIGQVIAPITIAISKAVKSLAEAFAGLSDTAIKFGLVFAGITPVLIAAKGALGLFGVTLGIAMGPAIALATAIGAITGAVVAFWPEIKRAGIVTSRVFGDMFKTVNEWATGIVGVITPTAKFIGEGFKYIYESAKQFLVDALKPVIESVTWFVNKVRSLFGELTEALGVEEMFKPVADGVSKAFEDTANQASEFTQRNIATIKQYWKEAGDEGAKEATEAAIKWTEPVITVISDATKKAQEEQRKLIEEGVRLTEGLKTPYDIMTDKIRALQAAQAAGKITAEAYGNAQTQAALVAQNAYAGMASDIASSLESVFGESKAFAIVSAIINTYEGFTKALAAYPPPFNYAAAAAVLAAGFAKVAAIKNTNKSSKGSGTSSGGGAAASTAGKNNGGGQSGGGATLTVQGLDRNELFTGAQVEELANRLLDFQRDGGKVILT